MSDAIVVESVRKTFGSKVAVSDLDLVVPRGSLYGFIGPNGAGKTTTIRMVMSILFPDSGRISVLGHGSALEAKDQIGYLPEERGVYRKMKVGAFLRYVARLKGADSPDLDRKIRHWLARVELGEVYGKRCEELSKGMQQKVQFLAAVIHEPDLLVLDEPFSGLDPVNMRVLRQLIHEQHERGATVIFSTHVMVQAEQLCDHIVMIHDGRKMLDDSIEGIRAQHDPRRVVLEPLDTSTDPTPLRSIPGVESVDVDGAAWQLALAEGADVSQVMGSAVTAVPAARVERYRPSLEDVFVEIVRGTGSSDEEARQLRDSLRDTDGPEEAQA